MTTYFETGKTYTFNSTSPAILGATFEKVTLVSTMTYALALNEINVDVMYRQIHPTLGADVPDAPKQEVYFKFQTQNNEFITLAASWINHATIQLIETINLRITISDVNLIDINTIKAILRSNGYPSLTIELI